LPDDAKPAARRIPTSLSPSYGTAMNVPRYCRRSEPPAVQDAGSKSRGLLVRSKRNIEQPLGVGRTRRVGKRRRPEQSTAPTTTRTPRGAPPYRPPLQIIRDKIIRTFFTGYQTWTCDRTNYIKKLPSTPTPPTNAYMHAMPVLVSVSIFPPDRRLKSAAFLSHDERLEIKCEEKHGPRSKHLHSC